MKTTKKDFELYCDECIKWMGMFGLVDWQCEFEHILLMGGLGAEVGYGTQGRLAIFRLSTNWNDQDGVKKTEENICRYAFHEVCHILLADIDKFVPACAENEYLRETHRIIGILENVLWANTEG